MDKTTKTILLVAGAIVAYGWWTKKQAAKNATGTSSATGRTAFRGGKTGICRELGSGEVVHNSPLPCPKNFEQVW